VRHETDKEREERYRKKPRLLKLGVKPESRVSVLNVDDPTFLKEVERAAAFVSAGKAAKNSDLIFYGVSKEAHLERLEKLKAFITSAGAIWVIRPKGRPEISEASVMEGGKLAGLVDVKVVSFSDTHTAEKFVIPVVNRRDRLRS